MVSLSDNKALFATIIAVSAVCAAAFAFWPCKKATSCMDNVVCRPQKDMCPAAAGRTLTTFRSAADSEKLTQLKSAWETAAEELTQGHKTRMKDWIESVFENTACLTPSQFHEVAGPFDKQLRNVFCGREVTDRYADVSEFRCLMEAGLEGMNMIGELELRVCKMQSPLEFREGDAFLTVNAYKSLFEGSRRLDLARCAGVLLDLLNQQIESERGLTHRYMRQLLDANMKMLVVNGTATREEVLRGVRSRAHWLESAGCSPKWLSEFDDLSAAEK